MNQTNPASGGRKPPDGSHQGAYAPARQREKDDELCQTPKILWMYSLNIRFSAA
jgi:hypothetical protein